MPTTPDTGIQPIGRALPETQALILSGSDQLCGLGEVGEIVIRTPFRTLGYLNAAAEQSQRFRPNPFRDDAEDIVYYTGDLGRYRLDGTIEILGRADHQVKIRGIRIELGEIEAVLMSHPSVSAAVVVARADELGDKRLVAYVVRSSEMVPAVSELRQFLQQRLPGYMVPADFVGLEGLPLTPNGKVDRQALPVPDLVQTSTDTAYVAPSTAIEAQLRRIWRELLKREQVGIHDNFFELGGHSLMATQVMSRLRDAFAVELSLHNLFEAPTVAELAKRIELLLWSTQAASQHRNDDVSYEEGTL